jgi:outer membrane protein OmpA-like peptidoglycan-associated protein/tetratricopeptide (TPR) repeat protein
MKPLYLKIIQAITILIIIFSLICKNANAQKRKFKEANKLYEEKAYFYAIPAYENAFEAYEKKKRKKIKEKKLIDAKIKLAECHRLVRDFENSERIYAEIIEEYEKLKPKVLFSYAKMLQSNGKYKAALQVYKNYVEKKPKDKYAKKYLADFEKLLNESKLRPEIVYRLRELPINSAASDYCPAFYKGGIIFASTRDKMKSHHSRWSGESFSDLYHAKGAIVTKLPTEINSIFNEGAVCFNSDSTVLYFTRNNFVNNTEQLSRNKHSKLTILKSELIDDQWTIPELVKFKDENNNYAHPAVLGDSLLFYASDRRGGFGGMDIYMVRKKKNKWGKATNLGETINTPGDDMFPYILNDTLLYFASDGHAGYGGLDIFMATKTGNNWNKVKNIQQPVNSSKDDFGFVVDTKREMGYITTNRYGNDDIYKVISAIGIEAKVVDLLTKKPLPYSTIFQTTVDSTINEKYRTNAEGNILLRLDPEMNQKLVAKQMLYLSDSMFLTVKEISRFHREDTLILYLPVDTALVFTMSGTIVDSVNLNSLYKAKAELHPHNLEQKRSDFISEREMELYNYFVQKKSVYTTSYNGKFHLEVHPAIDYDIVFDKDGYLPKVLVFESDSILTLIDNDSLIIHLDMPFLYGTIRNINDRQAIENAHIELQSGNLDKGEFINTKSDGKYSFRILPQFYDLRVNHNDYELHSTVIRVDTAYVLCSNEFGNKYFIKHYYYNDIPIINDQSQNLLSSIELKNRDYTVNDTLNILLEPKDKSEQLPVDEMVSNIDSIGNKSDKQGFIRNAFEETVYNEISSIGKIVKSVTELPAFCNVYFEVDRWNITKTYQYELDSVIKFMNKVSTSRILISAYADSTGNKIYNLGLSAKRAQEAEKYLLSKGIESDRIFIAPFGELPTSKKCPENDIECIKNALRENRKIEFRILLSDGRQ